MNVLKTILIAGIALLGATFAQAAGLENMTDAEREIFRAEVRAYLLDEPEVILDAIQVLEQREAQSEAQSDLNLVLANFEELTRDGYSWVGGNPDGAITIVEFSDYLCPFCKRAYPEIKILLENNDDVRFILKEFPILGPDSTLASEAAISVLINQGSEMYEAFHDSLMTNNGPMNIKVLSRLLKGVGGDVDLMLEHMDDEIVAQMIAKNQALASRMNISGTPSFLIGTEMLRGFAPASAMQNFVDRARSQLEQSR